MDLVKLITRIILKRSNVSGKRPTSSDLEAGELAINLADKALYSKTESGEIIRLNTPDSIESVKITNIADILS